MGLFSFLQHLHASRPSAVATRLAAIEGRIGRLTTAEAEAQVASLLAGGAFHVMPHEATPTPAGSELPAEAARLFARHASIALGGMVLDRSRIAPWTRATGYVLIGTDMEHAEVVVRSKDGVVAVIEDDGAPEPLLDDLHPSLWHFLLHVHAATHPDAPGPTAV